MEDKKIEEQKNNHLNYLQSNIHDFSFESLKNAFENYDIQRLDNGSVLVTNKHSGQIVNDPATVDMVEYSNIWFKEITANASRSIINGDIRNDERLREIAFGDIGKEAYYITKQSYFQAIDEMRTINGAKSGIALEDILRDKFNEKQKELTSSYGKDVLDVLSLENPEMAFLNSQGNRPELFQEKTLEFMKKAYITRECANEYNKIAKMSPADYKSTYGMQTGKTFIEKIKSAVDKIKSFITHKPEKTTEDTNNKNNDFERVM